ncbi:hypothetical protein AMTRI_Chr01g112470 [Amborella trichopoda]
MSNSAPAPSSPSSGNSTSTGSPPPSPPLTQASSPPPSLSPTLPSPPLPPPPQSSHNPPPPSPNSGNNPPESPPSPPGSGQNPPESPPTPPSQTPPNSSPPTRDPRVTSNPSPPPPPSSPLPGSPPSISNSPPSANPPPSSLSPPSSVPPPPKKESPPTHSSKSPPHPVTSSSPPPSNIISPRPPSDRLPPPDSSSPPQITSPPPSEGTPKTDSPPNLTPPIVPPPSGGSSPVTPTPSSPDRSVPSNSTSPPSQTSTKAPSTSPPSSWHGVTETGSGSGGGIGKNGAVGIAVAGVVLIGLIAVLFMFTRKRKRRADGLADPYRPSPGSFSVKSDGYYYRQAPAVGNSAFSDLGSAKRPPSPPPIGNGYAGYNGHGFQQGGPPEPSGLGHSKSWFTYEELVEITNGFSQNNLLGEGGFGCVYKGHLPDGREVAVKQLKAGGGQGEREFRAEVEIISRVHHRHLVSLVGYCIAEHHRLLVYEFVPNNTLEYHLHGRGQPVMSWGIRVKIALGAARGLAYLHEDCHPRIIHRDIKSANILLDNSFEAQVADFGLAKLTNDTYTHVSTRVMGTFGYMAPEYASSGKLTDRSDVFSFGVVLLELITGRKPVDTSQPLGDESLVEWARPLLSQAIDTGNFEELADPRLEQNFVGSNMFRMIEAAAACVRHSAPKRPRMAQVVRALENDSDISDLTNGVKPGQSTVFNSTQYSVDINRFRRMAFGSTDYSSDFPEGYSGGPHSSGHSGGPYSGTHSGGSHSREVGGPPTTRTNASLKLEDASSPIGSDYPSSGESETRALNHKRDERSFRTTNAR